MCLPLSEFTEFNLIPEYIPSGIINIKKYSPILTPYIIQNIELWFESWKNILFIKNDILEDCNNLYESLECWLFDYYVWYMRMAYKAVIERLKCEACVVLVEDNQIVDFRWLRYAYNSLFIFIIYITIIYTCSYGVNAMSINNNFSELNGAIFSNLDEVEEECGQLEDLITFFSYFLVFILWFYIFNIFGGSIITEHLQWILLVFSCLLVIGLVVPGAVFKKMGVACVQYIRGAGRFTSVAIEALLDFISLSVIVLRFFLQNIRFIFIFVGFLEYYEFINHLIILSKEYIHGFITYDSSVMLSTNIWYFLDFSAQLILQTILYLYYVGHLTVVYIAQLTIFLVLSFWVFFFFYTTYSISIFANYFKIKRNS